MGKDKPIASAPPTANLVTNPPINNQQPIAMPNAPLTSHGHSFTATATEHLLTHAIGHGIGYAIAGPPGALAGGFIAGLTHTAPLEGQNPPAPMPANNLPPSSTTLKKK